MHLRQDRMSNLERIEALFSYKRLDRVPIGSLNPGFQVKNFGVPIATAYEDPQKNFEAMLWVLEQYGWDSLTHLNGHTTLGTLDFGGIMRLPKGEFEGSLVEESFPVENESDVKRLKVPDPKRAGFLQLAVEFAKLQAEHGMPVTMYFRSPFGMAGNICGLEQFLKWLYKKPELCYRLMDLSIAHMCNVLDNWLETFGAEKLLVWMSSPSESNQVISPKHFEEFALPYHHRFHEKLEKTGVSRFGLHICGDQNLNLPLFSAHSPWQHPSILSFGHEVDLATAGQIFPEDIIFGNINPVVFQTKRPEEIYALCKIAIEKGKRARGGFVLGPGCGLPPFSIPANVYAMTKAVNDYGWYE